MHKIQEENADEVYEKEKTTQAQWGQENGKYCSHKDVYQNDRNDKSSN